MWDNLCTVCLIRCGGRAKRFQLSARLGAAADQRAVRPLPRVEMKLAMAEQSAHIQFIHLCPDDSSRLRAFAVQLRLLGVHCAGIQVHAA